jgi:hypothetical protein
MQMRTVLLCIAILASSIPGSSAMAFGFNDDFSRSAARKADPRGYLGVHDGPNYERCRRSSAAEGNANQQTRPVKQYGQVSGGYRC